MTLSVDDLWVESSPRLRPYGVMHKISEFLQSEKIYIKEIHTNADGNIVLVPNPVHEHDDNYWHRMAQGYYSKRGTMPN